jgi:Tfp pilus assembly protein PilZ
MIRHTERRNDIRNIYKAPISVQELNNIYIYRARLINFSAKGMYIETEIALDVGTDLIIGIEDSKLTSLTAAPDNPVFFRAKILWQKDLTNSIFNFGYGSKIISMADDLKTFETDLPVEQELRKHPRKSCQKQIYFAWNNQYSKGTIDNISRGGVSILTRDKPSVGQTIRFVIAGTKYDNGVMLRGKVAYTSPKGVGVKILGII